MRGAEGWQCKIGMADMHGTVADVTWMPPEAEDEEGMVSVVFSSGGGQLRSAPTPEALRQVAGAFLDGADAMEASRR